MEVSATTQLDHSTATATPQDSMENYAMTTSTTALTAHAKTEECAQTESTRLHVLVPMGQMAHCVNPQTRGSEPLRPRRPVVQTTDYQMKKLPE
jgi:hypothetical protein